MKVILEKLEVFVNEEVIAGGVFGVIQLTNDHYSKHPLSDSFAKTKPPNPCIFSFNLLQFFFQSHSDH